MDTIRLFISYRRDDSRHQVGRLHDRLVARFGTSCVFRDVSSVPLGSDFREVLTERISACDVFLAVIGDTWLSALDPSGRRRLDDSSDYVRIEIEAALRREIPVIPVLVGSAPVPAAAELPEGLRDLSFRHASPIRPDPDFHSDVDRLIVGIERAVDGARRRSDPDRGEIVWTSPSPSFDETSHPGPRVAPSSVASPTPEVPVPLPQSFGRYRILRRLGEKTRGSVLLADDPQHKRRVALKVPNFGSGRFTEARLRFLAEARALATLKNPHLCPVLDSGEIAGRPYLAMAYIEGKSLAATILPGGLPPRQVGVLVGKLALAMQEVHLKGVIHRNLKPANIIFNAAGQRHDPVIVDFGQTRTDIVGDARSGESDLAGRTFAYLAPEQLRGNFDEVGPACDIYALGVILLELLVGGLPSPGRGFAATGRWPSDALQSSSAHQGKLDPTLGAICRRAMATEVGVRYSTMAELAAALAEFLRSSPVAPPPTSSGGRPSPP